MFESFQFKLYIATVLLSIHLFFLTVCLSKATKTKLYNRSVVKHPTTHYMNSNHTTTKLITSMQQLYHTVTIQQTTFNNTTAILNSLLYNNQQLSYNHTATKLSLYKNKIRTIQQQNYNITTTCKTTNL